MSPNLATLEANRSVNVQWATIYNPSPTPTSPTLSWERYVHQRIFLSVFHLWGKVSFFPRGEDNSKYFINGGKRGLYMKWNCTVGNIVDLVDLLEALYRCFTQEFLYQQSFSCLLAFKQTNYVRQAMRITSKILKAMPDRNLCL